jgi:hypothetical protein
MKHLLLFITLIAASFGISAQDLIVKTDSTKVEAKITEISDFEIKYYDWDNQSGPLFIVAVDKIAYIKFANGKITNYANHANSLSTDVDAAAINRKNILKVSPFSPMTGHLDFEYERVFSKRMTCVSEVGIIGVNANKYADNKGLGVFFSGGVRFYKGQEIREKNTFYNNNFSGLYAQAKLGFEVYNFDYNYWTQTDDGSTEVTQNENVVGGSIMLGLGKQWVFGGRVTVDVGVALGYVFVNEFTYTTQEYVWDGSYTSNTYTITNSLFHTGNFGNDIGLAGDAWLRVGYIF